MIAGVVNRLHPGFQEGDGLGQDGAAGHPDPVASGGEFDARQAAVIGEEAGGGLVVGPQDADTVQVALQQQGVHAGGLLDGGEDQQRLQGHRAEGAHGHSVQLVADHGREDGNSAREVPHDGAKQGLVGGGHRSIKADRVRGEVGTSALRARPVA